jgi:hypothetical protein
MPNPIKYTAGTETLALKKGNFYIGTGDVGKGPSDTTGYYQGPSPASGGYVIYLNKSGVPGNLSYHSATNDSQLISFTNNLSGTSFTSATQCLNYYATQTDKVCFNRDYEGIVTSGLSVNVDAGFTPSYSTSGITWYDISGNLSNATLNNGPTYSSNGGGSIVFDGTDDTCTFPVNTFNGGSPQNGTFIWWIKFPNQQSTQKIIFNDGGSFGNTAISLYRNAATATNRYLTVIYYNNTIGGTSSYLGAINDLTPEEWYCVALTFNSSGKGTSYKNGTLISTETVSNFVSWRRTGNNLPILNPGTDVGTGNAAILQYYNRELSASEVLQNYQSMLSRFVGENIVTNGLVFYVDAGYPTSYPTSGLTWYDVSGYNNNGTLTNGPTYSGASIVFDGTDDYVSFGNKNNLGSEPFTINTWFNHIPDGDYQGVITKGTGSGIGIGYRILVTPDGRAYFDVSDNVTSNVFISNTGVGSNTWVNVVLVRESSNTFKGYINGVLDKTETKTVGSCTTSYDLRIGGQFDAPQYAFKGSISIASIYNRALSASEVLQNYNAQKGRFGL